MSTKPARPEPAEANPNTKQHNEPGGEARLTPTPSSVEDLAEARETAGVLPIDGRYQLQELIGRGAMGDVWVARDIIRSENVALKILRDGLEGEEFRARFWREARILTRINHPNVIQLFNYGTDPKPYIVMQLLTGQDLSRLLSNWKTLPLSHAADIFRQVAAGLGHVHEAGVLHRDIKPGNIFCVAGGPVKLVDFGLSKKEHSLAQGPRPDSAGDQFITQSGTLLGTVRYMSPEQLLDGHVDSQADLWSMAVVLFKMLTGSDPFDAKTEVDLMVRIIRGPTPLPSEVRKGMPQALDNFFRRAFQKRPKDRFASATEMADALITITKSVVRRRGDSGSGA